jgi:hypothetical protein
MLFKENNTVTKHTKSDGTKHIPHIGTQSGIALLNNVTPGNKHTISEKED